MNNGAITGAAQGAAASIPAMFLGAYVDALSAGLFAAIIASIWMPAIDDRLKSFSAILMSSVFAGYGAQIVCVYAIGKFPELVGVDIQGFRIFAALLIGFSTPLLIPPAVTYARNFLSGKGKRP